MSFLKLAEAEVKITQAMLLGNLFPEELEEIPEPQLPITLEPDTINNRQDIRVITLPSSGASSFTAVGEYRTENGIYIVSTVATYPSDTIDTNWTIFNQNVTSATCNTSFNNIHVTRTSTTTFTNVIVLSDIDTTQTMLSTCGTRGICVPNFNITPQPYKPYKIDKTVKKPIKSSIKRALKLLDNFGMEEDTKIFLSGDEIEVSHPDSLFKFVITKRRYNSIVSNAKNPPRSVPFGLELFTKTGIHISNLCVYAENTPMLDNLFMVAMYVKTGNEEDLLRTANYFQLTKDIELREILALEYPFLESKLLPHKPRRLNGSI